MYIHVFIFYTSFTKSNYFLFHPYECGKGVYVVLFKMWGDKSGPSLQCLHAAYAVGAFISPLVAKPFLQDVSDSVESGDKTLLNVSCNLVAGSMGFDSDAFLCNDYESSGCDLLPLCLNTSMAEACSGTNTSNSSSFYIQYDVNNVSNCTVVSSTETQITLLFGWAYWISAMVLLPSAIAFMYFAVRYDFRKCVKGKCSSSDHSQVLQTLDNPDGRAHEAEQLLLEDDEQELTKSESMASDVEQTSDKQEKAVSLSTDVEESEEDTETVPSSKEFVEKTSGKPTIVKTYKYPALILLFFFLLFYVGTELTYGRLILTYAVKSDLHFSKQKAAILAALFFGLFAFARFISIILALLKIRAAVMVSLNLTGTLLSVTLFIMLPHNDTAVWIASAGLGASFAAILPTVMAWLSEHLTVSGKAMSVVLAGANLGDILIPTLAGVLIGKVNPDSFVYFNFATIVTSATLMAILFFITFVYQRRHSPDVKGVQYKKLKEAVDLRTYPDANSSAEVEPSE